MVASKAELFEEISQKRANLFKALAHPVRLQILEFLVQSGTCLSGDISGLFPLARTTLNQHMNELKKAGLIKGHVKGSKIAYCLDATMVEELKSILKEFLNEIKLPQDFFNQIRND